MMPIIFKTILLALLGLVYLSLFAIRLSRWLALVQQKEYRLDRLWQFLLKTEEGREQLGHIFSEHSSLLNRNFKRPVRTLRVYVVALTALIYMLLMSSLVWWFYGMSLGVLFALLFVIFFVLPFLVMLALVPSALGAKLATAIVLNQASQKLRHAKPLVIGIGGCYGKTSTRHLLAHVLSYHQPVFTPPESYNTPWAIARTILRTFNTQPIAIIEYASYKAGEIKRLTDLFPPQIAIETGYTEQHLALFGSPEGIVAAESELVQALPKDAPVFCHSADPGAEKICQYGQRVSGAKIVPYTGPKSVVTLESVKTNLEGQLTFTWNGKKLTTNLVGEHYAINVAGVIAVAEHVGMRPEIIQQALTEFVPNHRFIRFFKGRAQSLVLDDGITSNPAGFRAMVEIARVIKRPEKILIFAGIVDLGDLSSQVHLDLAQAASTVFDRVYYSGQVGRKEFASVLGEKLVHDLVATRAHLLSVSQDTLVVIEGRVPGWVPEIVLTDRTNV